MKCTITDVLSNIVCSWCNKKTDGVQASIEGTFFLKSSLCHKCFRKALELRKRQETIVANANKSPAQQAGS